MNSSKNIRKSVQSRTGADHKEVQRELGRLFETARTLMGVSVEEVAAYLGVSEAAVRSYERGQKSIPLAHIYGLSNRLNVSPDLVMEYVNGWKLRISQLK